MKSIFINRDQSVRSGWKVLGFLLLAAVVSKLANLALRPAVPFLKAHADFLPGPVFGGLLMLIPTAVCLRLERAPLRSIGLDFGKRWAIQAALGTALGIGLILMTALAVSTLGGLHFVKNAGGSGRALLAGAWLYLGVAFFEELTFRGYPFQRLVKGMGAWPTQLLLGLFFALAHWSNPGMTGATKVWASLNIGLAGIFLGLAYLKTRSLALPMGIHLGWNWAQGTLLGFGVSGTPTSTSWYAPIFHGRPEWLTGGAFGLEASLPCLLILVASCAGLAFWKPASEVGRDRSPATAE